MENVAGQALGMDANQRRAASQIAHLERHGFFVLRRAAAASKAVDPKRAKFSGKVRFGHFFKRRRGVIVHDAFGEPLRLPL
jgi:hypothetical protein